MSKRIDQLKLELRRRIDLGSEGFVGKLPSIRELTVLFGESRHIVNAALKTLQSEGVLLVEPQKGFRVNPALHPARVTQNRMIEVLICEDLPWEVDFWCRMIRRFEEQHPGWSVSCRFIEKPEPAREFLQRRGGAPTVIIRCEPELLTPDRVLVPLAAIERCCGVPLTSGPLLPGREPDAYRLPYQVQCPMVFCAVRSGESEIPDCSSWRKLVESCDRLYGAESLLPFNPLILVQTLGLFRVTELAESELRRRLRELAEVIEFIQNRKLYRWNDIPEHRLGPTRMLLGNSNCRVLVRNSFHYGALCPPAPRSEIRLFPLPLAADGYQMLPICQLALAGLGCEEPEAEFFRFLLGPEVQDSMMREGLGFSPFRAPLLRALARPELYPEGYDRIINMLLAQPTPLTPETAHTSRLADQVNMMLVDHLLLPIFTDRAPDRETLIADCLARLQEIAREHAAGRQAARLRRQLLQNS